MSTNHPSSNLADPPHPHAADSMDPGSALAVACDPAADAAVLAGLAGHRDPRVIQALAANPNTPEDTLHGLWLRVPLALLDNPILSYRSFTTGKPFHRLIPEPVQLALYSALRDEGRLANLEAWMPGQVRASWLSSRSQSHSPAESFPDEQWQRIQSHLATDPSAEVRKAMPRRLGLRHLVVFATDPDPGIRMDVACHMPTSHDAVDEASLAIYEQVADILSTDAEMKVRALVAGTRCLTPRTHVRLSEDPCIEVRRELAVRGCGRQLGEAGWHALLAEDAKTLGMLAKNSECPDWVRFRLIESDETRVRTLAWSHLNFRTHGSPDALADALDRLCADPTKLPEQREVAANRSITRDVAARLIGCGPGVTRVLAENTVIDDEIRSRLLHHEDPETACKAMRHSLSSELLHQGMRHPNARVRVVLAGLPLRQLQDLRHTLALDPDARVRVAVFEYIKNHIPTHRGRKISEVLTILSKDPCPKIRARVVGDYRLPYEELRRLGKDPSVRVRLSVLDHCESDENRHYGLLGHRNVLVRRMAAEIIVGKFSSFSRDPRSVRTIERKLIRDPSPIIRSILAEEWNASGEALRRLIQDPSPQVQQTLVERTLPWRNADIERWAGAKTGVLKCFEADPNPYVRAIAAASKVVGARRTRRLAADPSWYVRAILAIHTRDPAVIETLSRDSHPLVRESARDRLRDQHDDVHDNASEPAPLPSA